MIERYRRLAERIRNELNELEREVKRAQKSWKASKRTTDPDPYIDSVALNLHGFYSGVERVFELIAEQVDEKLPAGETWHRDLASQMAREVRHVRPAVISSKIAADLDEFRKFRHLVRNVYTTHLDSKRMSALLSSLAPLWAALQVELNAFADFLDQLSRADESD